MKTVCLLKIVGMSHNMNNTINKDTFYQLYKQAHFFIFDKSLLELKLTKFNVAGLEAVCFSFLSFSVPPFELFSPFLELISLISLLAFKSLAFKSGTLGVLTGSMGEFVRDLLPKNLEGFSGPLGVASNLALPLATAPRKDKKRQKINCNQN